MKRTEAETPNPKILSPETAHVAAFWAWKIIDKFLHPEIMQEDYDNLQKWNELLAEKKRIVAVAYHPGQIEAVLLPLLLKSHLPDLENVFGPMAADQYHRLPGRVWSMFAAAFFSTFAFPVVRQNNSKDARFKSHALAYTKQLFSFSNQEFARGGSVYGIVPFATRGKILTGELNTSLTKLARHPGTNYTAVAVYRDQKSVHARIGEPFSLDTMPQQEGVINTPLLQTEWIMRHVARLIPPQLRGDYQPYPPIENDDI